MFRRSRRKKTGILKRSVRAVFSVFILSSLVLGISLFIRKVASLDQQEFTKIASPILGRLNLDEDVAGEVAGEFVERISATGIVKSTEGMTGSDLLSSKTTSDSQNPVKSRIALLADSGNEFDKLEWAVESVQESDTDLLIHLGDLTNWGDTESLSQVYEILSNSNLMWYVLPGDHDLGESVGPENFLQVFGDRDFVFTDNGYKFVGFDNSANFTPVEADRMSWFEQQVKDADFVLLSQPLYHRSLEVTMGNNFGDDVPELLDQAQQMLSYIRDSDVKAVIAADQHMYSKSVDPTKEGLVHIVVGALADERNPVSPRYSILRVYEDDTFDIEVVTID